VDTVFFSYFSDEFFFRGRAKKLVRLYGECRGIKILYMFSLVGFHFVVFSFYHHSGYLGYSFSLCIYFSTCFLNRLLCVLFSSC
jgi:hypothetical protein